MGGGYLDLWLRRASDDAVASFSKDWWQTIPVFGIGSLLQFSLSGSAAVKEEASSFLLYGVAAVMVWGTLKVVFRLAKVTPISGILASKNDPLSLRL